MSTIMTMDEMVFEIVSTGSIDTMINNYKILQHFTLERYNLSN